MTSIKDLVRTRSGMLSEFTAQVKELLKDPVKSAAIDNIEQKLSNAGIIFLDQFLDTSMKELEGYLLEPPAASIAWLTTFERVGGFRFEKGSAPSASCGAGTDGEVKQLNAAGRRGGRRDNRLRSPTRGVTPLGEWLRSQNRLGEVKEYFSDIALYAHTISFDVDNFFKTKPLQRDVALTAMTDMVVKVSYPASPCPMP